MTNATGVAQQEGQETAEKLDKLQPQNQSSKASKGQPREVSSQKENVGPVVQTNLAQKTNNQTSSKANQSDKSSQSNQTTSKSSLPNTGDVSSLGLGALGAVLMTTSFALKGSKHSRK